jgi:DNA modification methylase
VNKLFYGDNLDVLRRKVKEGTVDLCYIDPPFNSKRNYNQIYNNVGGEDRAQAQAFTDTWVWDDAANFGYAEILDNAEGRFSPQLVDLLKGLQPVLRKGSLLAYLVSMALRITEIRRVLKDTGSFFLHCDPTASHYLKIMADAVFVPQGGDFRNEVIWHYLKWSVAQRQFVSNHDVILFYSKSDDKSRTFNTLFVERSPATKRRFGNAKIVSSHSSTGERQPSQTEGESEGVAMDDVWDISRVPPIKQLYPTEKPEALLERIILATTNEGDVVLDAYCGCGTTIVSAEALKRQWLGIDITYQSISLILRRMEHTYGPDKLNDIITDGIPRDLDSASALAHKKDDRLRKEFEKWAVLTFTNNRAIINEKKGADAGVDGIAHFRIGRDDNAKMIFQVKSGGVNRGDIAKLHGDMEREGAALAFFITLEDATAPMRQEAKAVGQFRIEDMGRSYDRISIVTVRDLVEGNARLEIPMSLEVLKAAQRANDSTQLDLL